MWSLLLLLAARYQSAQSMDHWGTEFLLAFPPNMNVNGFTAIYVTAREAATVFVENSLLHQSHILVLKENSSAMLNLTADVMYMSQNVVEDKTVYVNATSEISVYAINYVSKSAGMHLVYPSKTMGKNYFLVGYNRSSIVNKGPNLVVAALYDNTTVEIQLRLADGGHCLNGTKVDGDVINVTLQSRQVWGMSCSVDFVGSVLNSSQPVSVTAGLACANVPPVVGLCDYIAEAILPVEDLGRTYILHDLEYRTSGVIYRVVSPFDDNVVKLSKGQSITLNKGQYADLDVSSILLDLVSTEKCIESSRPVTTLMFTKGSSTDPLVGFGDPSMAVVPPVESFTSDYVINAQIIPNENMERRVAITIETASVKGLQLPSQTTFSEIGCGYSVGHVVLDESTYRLKHQSGAVFGAMVYVSGNQFGIATLGGMKLIDKFDYCASEPCQNGANCTNDAEFSKYLCVCTEGFNGTDCEINIDECLSSPCQNDGNCTDEINAFNCTCLPGYSGAYCETDVSTKGTTNAIDTTFLLTQETPTTTGPISTPSWTTRPKSTVSLETPRDSTLLSSAKPKPVTRLACPCHCIMAKEKNSPEELQKQAHEQAQQIKQELTIDKKELSSTSRKDYSVYDDRPSAVGIGFLGVSFLVMVFAAIALMDVTAALCKVKDKAGKKNEGKKFNAR